MGTCLGCDVRDGTTMRLCDSCRGILESQRLPIGGSMWGLLMRVLREYRRRWQQDMEALLVHNSDVKKQAHNNRMDGELAVGVCHRLDAKSAKAFVKWLGLSASTARVHVSGVEGGNMYSRTVSISDALTDFLAHIEEHESEG